MLHKGEACGELGTSTDPRSKANDDYVNRTKNPIGINPQETIFIAVSLREWRDRHDWEETKRKDGIWLDVRAFDLDDIEQALEAAPAAHFWLSEVLGKPASSARTIEDWWKRFADLSSPPLSPALVLAGRADASAQLLRILEEDSRVTTVASASTDDVLAFVACTILSSPEDQRLDLLSRTLIVSDAMTLRQLDTVSGLLILLPWVEELRRDAQLVSGHHIVLLAPSGSPSDIALPPVDRAAFAAELHALGVPEEQARQLAAAAHRSLVAFQRAAPRRGRPARPDWTVTLTSRVIRRAALAGGWTERRSGDLDVLATLIDAKYDDARDELLKTTMVADPLFSCAGDTWSVVLPRDVWGHLSGTLSNADIAALETAVQTVLGAVDPALELPVEDRWKAAIYGKTRVHSSDLRTGLATTLAVMGTYGASFNVGAGQTIQDRAEGIVFRLLSRANDDPSGQLWASLSDALPLVAEAAPDVFLGAVEKGVTGADPVLRTMFQDRGDALSVSSPHTGLLWALEAIAWSEERLGMVGDLLTRLAEVDPGGRLANRPINSLVAVFRPWLPQTSAPAERRLAVLDGLQAQHAGIAWRLFLELLPKHHDLGFRTHSPTFRDWKPPDEEEESTEETQGG